MTDEATTGSHPTTDHATDAGAAGETAVTEAPTERTKVRRGATRATYDPTVIRAVIDAAPVCHVAVSTPSGPMALPMAHGRVDDELYLHGALANAVLEASVNSQMSVTFTELNGLVVARSAFHNSMNYRCVVVFGQGRRVEGDEKVSALRSVADHVVPTWDSGRPPSAAEIRRTLVVALELTEASAKVRSGDPVDEPEDTAGPWWAGTVPLRQHWGAPVPAADLPEGISVPGPVAELGG